MIKLAFDPDKLKETDDAWIAFNSHPIVLKFWALYKKHFITSQYFRDALLSLHHRITNINNGDVPPYSNIDEFMSMLYACGLCDRPSCMSSAQLSKWVVQYWDYFNWNIQKSLELSYSAVRPCTGVLSVGTELIKSEIIDAQALQQEVQKPD